MTDYELEQHRQAVRDLEEMRRQRDAWEGEALRLQEELERG